MKKTVAPLALELKNLTFNFSGGRSLSGSVKSAPHVLNIESLNVPVGEHTLIYGDSGCGKSTLLNLVSGVLSGARGSIRVLGTQLSELSATARDKFRAQNVAVIFQQFNLIPYLTVRENIELGLKLSGRAADNGRINEILSHLQIAEFAGQGAMTLSHGQQQRVAAARAIINESPLILADEPTSALDDTNARLFLDLLFREAELKGTTVVVVSHDLRYKKRFGQTIDLAKLNHAGAKVR
jgi:putative ABC transport system ATP-binding protein